MSEGWRRSGEYRPLPQKPHLSLHGHPASSFWTSSALGAGLCNVGRRLWNILRGLLPFFSLLAFSFLGGLVFYALEGSHVVEARRVELDRILKAKNSSAGELIESMLSLCNATLSRADAEEVFETFSHRMGFRPKVAFEWSYWGSVFYAGTLTTTIGYGTMTPVTLGGKVMTIVVALLGIPLVLYTINTMGKLFGRWTWTAYAFVKVYVLGRCVRSSDSSPERLSEIPLGVAIGVAIVWTLGCSLLFCLWEKDWTLFDSFYFFFQSLTTIGLGDVTPRHTDYMVWSFILILVGLALFSMCWTLAQLKLDAVVGRLKARIRSKALEEMDQDAWETNAQHGTKKISEDRTEVMMGESWVNAFLSEGRKAELVAEWERKARKRNRATQTTAKELTHSTTQHHSLFADQALQANLGPDRSRWGGFYAPPPLTQGSRMIYRTTPGRYYGGSRCAKARTRSSDDARNLFSQVGLLLDDCVQILSENPTSAESTNPPSNTASTLSAS